MYVPNKPVALRAAGAIAVPTTEYGVYDPAKISSTATSTSTNNLADTAGNFVVNAIAVGDIVKNTTTGKYALVTAVTSATALALSADIMTSGNAYTIYPGLGIKVNSYGQYSKMLVELAVTAAATDVGDTLDVYVDTSWDGGITWFNIGHFTQVLGNGGVKTFIMALGQDNPGTADIYEKSSDCAVTTTRPIGFGDRLRSRAVVVDAGTQNASFNYTLTAYMKQ